MAVMVSCGRDRPSRYWTKPTAKRGLSVCFGRPQDHAAGVFAEATDLTSCFPCKSTPRNPRKMVIHEGVPFSVYAGFSRAVGLRSGF